MLELPEVSLAKLTSSVGFKRIQCPVGFQGSDRDNCMGVIGSDVYRSQQPVSIFAYFSDRVVNGLSFDGVKDQRFALKFRPSLLFEDWQRPEDLDTDCDNDLSIRVRRRGAMCRTCGW
jgi:hypothetical protein